MNKSNKVNKALLASTYEVKIDLIEDWNHLLNERMRKMGYKPKKEGYTSYDYHKAMKKLITIRPRRIYYSKEFACPDECKTALSELIKNIEAGENLVPYMSKQVTDPAFNDGLLNDWGIYHFHLNAKKENVSGFVKRSDWLLLAFLKEEGAYFLNVYPHKTPFLWTHIKLIEIIHSNWPELIGKNKLDGIVGLTEKLDDKSYSELRKANISTFVELGENQVYGLIGGGYASDGSSIEAVRTSDHWHNYMLQIELFIKDEYANFKRQMLPFDVGSMEKSLEIQLLTLTDAELILLEKQRNVIIKINHINGNIRMCKLASLLDENISIARIFLPLTGIN
jgi:hypothetical protein